MELVFACCMMLILLMIRQMFARQAWMTGKTPEVPESVHFLWRRWPAHASEISHRTCAQSSRHIKTAAHTCPEWRPMPHAGAYHSAAARTLALGQGRRRSSC